MLEIYTRNIMLPTPPLTPPGSPPLFPDITLLPDIPQTIPDFLEEIHRMLDEIISRIN